MNPIRLEIFIDDKTRAGIQSAEGNIGQIQGYMQAVINQLETQLKELQQQFNATFSQGMNADRELADVQALKGAIEQLKAELKELEVQKKKTDSTPIMGDDPAPKLNNVKFSMQQIARELPSLAMGPQMFFLAISNNIPMFTDAVTSARKEYDLLTSAGKKATPVWKQLLSSLFSWQTAMVTAITLTVVYGKEIGELISGLFKENKALDINRQTIEDLNAVRQNAIKDSQKEITSLKLLYNATQDYNKPVGERKKIVGELQKLYPDYFKNLSSEEILAGNAADAYERLATQILSSARAKAVADKITEKQNLILEKNEEKLLLEAELESKRNGTLGRIASQPQYGPMTGGAMVQGTKESLDAIEQKIGTIANEIYQLQKQSNDLSKEVNASDLIFDPNGKKDNKRIPHDYMTELADARIRAQQKLEAARISILKDGYDKRKLLARQELKENLSAIDKEERETIKKMDAAKKQGKTITPDQYKEVKNNAESRRALAQITYAHDLFSIEQEWRDKNMQSWIDYNKEYGTYQDKRLAIAQDYALKIAKAETQGEKASLKKKQERDLKELDFSEFKASINMADVFGNLDEQSTDALSVLRDKLKEYINAAAKNLKPSDLKELQNALAQIDIKLSDRKPFRELKKSLEEYQDAQEEVSKAQDDLNTVMNGGEIITGLYIDSTGKLVKKLLTQEQAEKNLGDAQNKRQQKQSMLARSIQGVADEMLSYGQAGTDIINMLEGFGVEVDENVKGVVEGFNTMSEGIDQFAQSLLTMDIGGMISGVVNTVGGAIKSIGSLFGADWGGERSIRRYEQAKERYESYMAVLDKVISKQKELVASMNTDNWENANNSYKKAGQLLKEQQNYAREMGRAYLDSGASKGFMGIGSKASRGTKQREDISSSAWQQAQKVLGSDYSKVADGRMTGLFDLSYEKLVKLRDEASGFWGELHQETQDYLNQIIESEEAWQEVQNIRKETITQLSFDDLRNSFLDTLMDMDSSAEDFANNFEKYMQRAMLNSMLSKSYNERLQQWYDSFASAMEEKTKRKTGWFGFGKKEVTEEAGILNDEEYKELQSVWDKIVQDATADRDALKKLMGWTGDEDTSSQSGRAGSFTTMSQEQGTKLEGLFTSLQDHASAIHKLMDELMKGRNADKEIFLQIAKNTAYCKLLEDILEIIIRNDRDGWKLNG